MGRPRKNFEEDEEKAEEIDEEVESKIEEEGKMFTILDSNGKIFRVVKTEEEANELIKIVSGRLKR